MVTASNNVNHQKGNEAWPTTWNPNLSLPAISK
jgi:hypothetical protein